MGKGSCKKIVFISSYPPRRCGIATFTSDLISSISLAGRENFEPLVVAMQTGEQGYSEPVKFEIRPEVKNDYISAADYINFSHVDLVNIQHEFGLFGGEAGSYLNLLIERINAPVITTLHTVRETPEPAYHKSTVAVCNGSEKVIVMNERGIRMLRDIYGIAESKIELIPHGIPDLPFVDSSYYKHKFGIEGRRTILTFGLLSRNKGIETVLKAMPAIIESEPTVLYIILGMTHPQVLRYDGESYRFGLQRLAEEMGCSEHVMFVNRFVSDEELHNFLCATDVYITPYQNAEQLTSGTLSFAVGAGKAVVSTPYWAAEELLADGRGKLVKFGDPKKLAEAIVEIFKNDSLYYSLRRKAYDYGRSRIWPQIGQAYWKLFNTVEQPLRKSADASGSSVKEKTSIELPEPSLIHLRRLTDDTGIFQHACFTIPERKNGYCTDDNARAVIAMTKYYSQYADAQALRLLDIYLAFIMHSQDEKGYVRNLMKFDRSWAADEAINDAHGRVLWAYGTVLANPPSSAYIPVIKDRFDNSAQHINGQMPHGLAYSILGMADYLKQFPGASEIKRRMEFAADKLLALYEQNSTDDWQWFENRLVYDNAVFPCALYAAGQVLGDKYVEVADKTCRFLLSQTYNGSHFSFVGCQGWFPKGGRKAKFDQQPIEIASTVMMLKAAYDASGDGSFLKLQKKAFDWFLGENDLGLAVYDFKTKGCRDGLMECGVNENEGAESLLSFLLSLLTISENYTPANRLQDGRSISAMGKGRKQSMASRSNPSEGNEKEMLFPIIEIPSKGVAKNSTTKPT
jgi:glycosyltransferase involved in cell wall biosynthesis